MQSLSPHKSASSSSSSPHLPHLGSCAALLSSPRLSLSHTHSRAHYARTCILFLPSSFYLILLLVLLVFSCCSALIAIPTSSKLSRVLSLQMVGCNPVAKPAWLEGLLNEKFFSPCESHFPLKKIERNIYCLDCSLAICQHCILVHPQLHRLLQIRRYVYHDVIRMQDIQKLLDCAFVQPYIINSAKVVFLNQRPQPRTSKGQGNSCETCERSLQDSFKYCSVACKVESVVKQGKELQGLLCLCKPLPDLHVRSSSSLEFPSQSCIVATKGPVFIGDDDERDEQEQLSPNSVHRGPNLNSPTSSSSTANDSILWEPAVATKSLSKRLLGSHLPRIARIASCKEQSSCASGEATFRPHLPCMKRRKGIPRRSPIF